MNNSSSTSDQTGSASSNQAAGSSNSDQNASGTAANQNAGSNSSAKGGKLPQTGSELPLLGLLGIGSLSAGVWKAYLKK